MSLASLRLRSASLSSSLDEDIWARLDFFTGRRGEESDAEDTPWAGTVLSGIGSGSNDSWRDRAAVLPRLVGGLMAGMGELRSGLALTFPLF